MTVLLMMYGTAETATSITTTPLTVGVNIRRREARRRVKTNCNRVEATSRLASRPGPPAWRARAHTARKGDVEVGDDEPPRAQVPEPQRVQYHAGPGDNQGGEYHPSQVGTGLAGCPHHQRRQHDKPDGVGYEYL